MVTFITGPMFSFKSSELFKHIERNLFAKKKIILIRPVKDDRSYFSHSDAVNIGYNNYDIKVIKIDKFEDLRDEEGLNILVRDEIDSVFIDECFMIKDVYKIADLFGDMMDVYYAGLLASSDNIVFEEVAKLLPYCETIIKLNGVCMECGSQLGNYSFHTGTKTSDIEVGDTVYKVLCKKCRDHLQKNKLSPLC